MASLAGRTRKASRGRVPVSVIENRRQESALRREDGAAEDLRNETLEVGIAGPNGTGVHAVAIIRGQPSEVRGGLGRIQVVKKGPIRTRYRARGDDPCTACGGAANVAVVLERVMSNRIVPRAEIAVRAIPRVRRQVLHVRLPCEGRARAFEQIDDVWGGPCRVRARIRVR